MCITALFSSTLESKRPEFYGALTPQLTPNIREYYYARLPEDTQTGQHNQRHRERISLPRKRYPYPDRIERDGEEVREEHEGLADDACQQADRAIDAVAAELEVAEAAELKGTEVHL